MILLYIAVGGILGFISFGPAGRLFGIGLGVAFSVSQAAQNKTAELESKVELLELKLNDEIIAIKELIQDKA